jgi:signal transduction histidine kinase
MESTPRHVSGAAPAGVSPAWPALFESEADLDALERMLLAWGAHPEGAGAERTWLLLWNARTGLLEGWREAEQDTEAKDLAAALVRARRGSQADRRAEERARAWAEAPETLEGVLAQAWRGAVSSFGPGATQSSSPWAEQKQVGAVILRRGTRAYGVLVAGWADEQPCGEGNDRFERMELLRRAADAALGAQARAAEARRRARQAAAMAEYARTSVSAINLAEAMHLLARLSAQGVGVRGAAVFRTNDEAVTRLEVAHGAGVLRERLAAGFAEVARETVQHKLARSGERPDEAPGVPADVAGETTVWAALPILAYDRVLGVLVVHDGLERHPSAPTFERGDMEYLAALADMAAMVLEHARRLADQGKLEQQRRELATRLREQERLASLGELAARVAQESRNPLASIAAFAKRAHKSLADDDPQREYLEIVIREAARLEAMMSEQQQYASLGAPRLQMQSLNAVVQEALQRSSETLVRRRVRLLKKLAPDLPQLLLDAPRIQRVVENVVEFALESLPLGGRLKVESQRVQGFVVVEISHDGAREAGDLLEQLFVPFAAGQAGGASVGLGVAQQIVREHGGEIRVRSEGEWGTVFSFTLPVAGNEDRRKASDRRGARPERRRRQP